MLTAETGVGSEEASSLDIAFDVRVTNMNDYISSPKDYYEHVTFQIKYIVTTVDLSTRSLSLQAKDSFENKSGDAEGAGLSEHR